MAVRARSDGVMIRIRGMRRTFTLVPAMNYAKRGILVVNSRHCGAVLDALSELKPIFIDLKSPTLFISLRFFWKLQRLRRSHSNEVAYVAAVIEFLDIGVVVSTDALTTADKQSILHLVRTLLPGVEAISVPHGSYAPGLEYHPIDNFTGELVVIETDVILASIGERDKESYSRWGLKHREVVPIGLLTSALHSSISSENNIHKDSDICLIEHLPSFTKKLGPLEEQAFAQIERLCTLVKEYVKLNGLSIVVALRPKNSSIIDDDGDNIEIVKDWFVRRLGGLCSFTDSSIEFATHRACDSSEVTICVDSTAVLDSFSRGNKVLTIWNEHSPLGFPSHELCMLVNPSFEQFSKSLDLIRNMPNEEYLNRTSKIGDWLVKRDATVKADARLRELVEGRLHGTKGFDRW